MTATATTSFPATWLMRVVRWVNVDGLSGKQIAARLNAEAVTVPRWNDTDRLPPAVEWRIVRLNGGYNLLRGSDSGRWTDEAVALVLASVEAQSANILALPRQHFPDGDGKHLRITVDVAPATAADGYEPH